MHGSAADTPMFRQYLEIKAKVPDALLFYRMGDFYELFFDDAKEAAELLELTLTSRNKNDPDPIPMCGVPHHAAQAYLRQLVDAGRKVAIAEQAEADGPTKLMERSLVRVVTPGIPFDADALEAREPCWLAAMTGGGPVGLAFLDTSTGDLRVTDCPDEEAAWSEIVRMEPKEIVSTAGAFERASAIPRTTADPAWFDEAAAATALCRLLAVADLTGFGVPRGSPCIGAAGALVSYAREVARVDLSHVRTLVRYETDGHLVLDEATRRNLEILRPLRGSGRKGTLLHLLDGTRTSMGARLLREWLSFPLTDVAAIDRRLDAVEALTSGSLRGELREELRTVGDLDRLVGKASQGTASARDLGALRSSLEAAAEIAARVGEREILGRAFPEDLAPDVAQDVARWLVDEPPAQITEGGLVRSGAHGELDELRSLAREGKGAIAAMEARERARTGIASLKVRYNRVFGYFLEVTHANKDKVPADWLRKQTLTGAERYITPELKEFEDKVVGADERCNDIELDLFKALRGRVASAASRIQAVGRAVAFLDVVAALADVAVERRYARPRLDISTDLTIRAGRHPVVEAMGGDERFVPNDVHLDAARRLVVLTGPNMAGKSTVMRQVALIALLAQIGSFVPAAEAQIGICDRIFVRVGASDDVAHGRSTFMVEMSETAAILNQATERSLVLLDEIGRGTSTYAGLAIAWAVAEAMHDRIGARTIFATHYHELTTLADERPGVVNQHVAVSEWGERIVFLRALQEGGASKSYGIQCARLAGMPSPVIERAKMLLAELESRPRHGPPTQQLRLFAPEAAQPAVHPLAKLLESADADALSPREALDLVYRLKSTLR